MTAFGDKLKQALDEKANNVNNYIWKGPKVNGVQQEIKLMDVDYNQLKTYYEHCKQMLYNTNSKNPGRLVLIDIVNDQIKRCRAELLIRWFRAEKQYTNTRCLEDLKRVINQNKDVLTQEAIKEYPIGNIISGLPLDYAEVPVSLVMDACLDSLGMFDSSHLTLNFLIRMGFYFTRQEMHKELLKRDPATGKAMDRLELIRSEFKIDPKTILRVNDKTGLSYAEFKAMYKLKKDKYANLTSEQLRLLSNKILYRFQNQCAAQAKQWEMKMEEIEKVANVKGWDVSRDIN